MVDVEVGSCPIALEGALPELLAAAPLVYEELLRTLLISDDEFGLSWVVNLGV